MLNLVAKVVPQESIKNAEVQDIIDRMFKVANGLQVDPKYPTLVGLAAPQLGISKRIVLIGMNAVGVGEQPELQAFVDPEIVERSDETEGGREGCFSTGQVCGIV